MSDLGSPHASTTVRGLLQACHLQPTLAVTGFTTALAVSADQGRRSYAIGAAVLCGQLAVGWSNDFIDRSRDTVARRTDKPIVAGLVAPNVVRDAAVAAAIACIPLSLLAGRRAAAVHLAAVGSGLAYNLGLKRTPFSVAPYVAAFGALPAFVTLSAEKPSLPPTWTIAAAALLGAGAHFINVLPDVEADTLTSVRGLPQRLGPTRALYGGAAMLAGSLAVVAAFGGHPVPPVQRALVAANTMTLAALVGAARVGRSRRAWSLAMASAASTVALCVCKRPLRAVAA
ncbi:MAG: putative integral rane protein [Ilumatobacteraceae bacterium]|nr:putative integral rane protein [Ilumatobacteraceae bacterium]